MNTLRVALGLCLAYGIEAASYRVESFAGGGAGGDGGPALSARFVALEGIAVGLDGSIYLADAGESRLRRIEFAPGAGRGTINAFAPGAGLKNPYGLAADRSGNVYVADYGNGRVRRIGPDGVMTDVAVGLKGPRNVAVNSAGKVYISDFEAGKVFEVAPGGKPAALEIAGLVRPAGLALDASGGLYVADPQSGTVLRYAGGQTEVLIKNLDTPTGVAIGAGQMLFVTGVKFLYTMARQANGFVLAAGPAAGDIASDGTGGVVMVAGTRVLRIRATGANEVVAGAGNGNAAVQPVGPVLAKDALLNGPIGLAADARGNVYIAEEGVARIARVDVAGVMTAVGESAAITDPVAVAVTQAGGLLFAEYGPKRVRSLAPNGSVSALLSSATVSGPRGIAVDPLGNWYVADAIANRVLRISASGTVTAIGQGSLMKPSALAVEASGALLVADSGNHRIRRYEPATGAWRTIAGTGVAGDSGDGRAAVEAQLNFPVGLAAAPDGSVYVADTYNNRVRRIGADGLIETLAAAPALDTPSGVALGLEGEIYVADLGHQRVVRLVRTSGPVETAPLNEPEAPPMALDILHAASGAAGALAPRQLFQLRGVTFEGAEIFLDGQQSGVRTGGDGASLAFVLVPDRAAGTMKVEVRRAGRVTGIGQVMIVPRAPALFTDSSRTALASDARGALRSLLPGAIVSFYATGEGLDPGQVRLTLATPNGPEPLVVTYAGSAPGLAGILQINARIPSGTPAKRYGLELTVGETASVATAEVSIE